MLYKHSIYNIVENNWNVLAVCPGSTTFKRANCVIDNTAYESRNKRDFHLMNEFFKKDDWIEQDVCNTPWNFSDNQFDFVVVGQKIVNLRDPISVLKEVERVGKKGYIETPNVLLELIREFEKPNFVGKVSSRWYADLHNNKIRFIAKPAYSQTDKNLHFSLPGGSGTTINPKYTASGFFWNKHLEAFEDLQESDFPDWYIENNLWRIKTLYEKGMPNSLLNLEAMLPVLFEETPFKENEIIEIGKVKPSFSLPLYLKNGNINPEVSKLEMLLATKINQTFIEDKK